jgi:hypothetical protein
MASMVKDFEEAERVRECEFAYFLPILCTQSRDGSAKRQLGARSKFLWEECLDSARGVKTSQIGAKGL